MQIIAKLEGVDRLAAGVWQADLTGIDIPAATGGPLQADVSTVLAVHELGYDAHDRELVCDYRSLRLLVRGDDATAILLASRGEREANSEATVHTEGEQARSPIWGDSAFEEFVTRLSESAADTARALLHQIRQVDPDGELERRGRRFVNRPDNFVALEPQTRLNQIIVHVRGIVPTNLPPVPTQRGYSAFKVSGMEDVDEAASVIGRANRKF